MIPYDDLVAALQAWRARQGLPVAAPSTGSVPATMAAPGSGPRTAPPPPRTNPPAPPPMAARTPMPLEAPDETHEEIHEDEAIEEHALIEDSHYENEGDDFAMSFAADGHNGHVSGPEADGTETMVGHDPLEPEHPELPDPAAAHRSGRDDW
jgi:hypothetical protein